MGKENSTVRSDFFIIIYILVVYKLITVFIVNLLKILQVYSKTLRFASNSPYLLVIIHKPIHI